MKLVLIMASLLFLGSAFAKDIKFKCEMNSDITYKNQFSLDVKSFTDGDETFEEMEFDFTIRNAGHDSRQERLVVTRSGDVRYFQSGTFANKISFGLTSAIKGDAVELVRLNVDFAGFFHSRIRLLDGTTYFSTCKSL